MKKTNVIFFLTILVCQALYSQTEKGAGVRFVFHGIVMDASTLNPIPGSQIFINRSFHSVSETDGTFALNVRRNDTVLFSVLGYKPVSFSVSDTLMGREFNTGIFMQTDTLAIGEVIILPRYANLKSDILYARPEQKTEIDNARFNVAVSAYQGLHSQGSIGDAATNYEILRQKHRIEAYEKGGIPSDRMVGISPFLLIPAAYLLIHGFPEQASSMKPALTPQEIDQLFRKYLETSRADKK